MGAGKSFCHIFPRPCSCQITKPCPLKIDGLSTEEFGVLDYAVMGHGMLAVRIKPNCNDMVSQSARRNALFTLTASLSIGAGFASGHPGKIHTKNLL